MAQTSRQQDSQVVADAEKQDTGDTNAPGECTFDKYIKKQKQKLSLTKYKLATVLGPEEDHDLLFDMRTFQHML